MNPPTEIVAHSRVSPRARAASALLGRFFAFVGGIAIGIVVTLARISGAVVAEIFLQILLLILWLNVLVKIFGWGCILIGALFQYRDPSDLHKNLFMIGFGIAALIVAHTMAVLEYQIRRYQYRIMESSYYTALRFPGSPDESFY